MDGDRGRDGLREVRRAAHRRAHHPDEGRMTTQAQPHRTAEIPDFPKKRSARCSFDPPARYRY
ncbi:hypothetical protein STPH1_7350 [Streptomyces sp. OM5714]|nr:hypothetical protein STPH1_7350 [Streptomyces sp. OM5714]